MKKLLMVCTMLMAGTAVMKAQFPSIGIIGSATSVGWDGPDIDMATTDGIVYTLEDIPLVTGGLKFRQDNAWNGLNWGNASEWPTGTGLQDQNGQDVQCQPGLYDITFNLETKAYSFVDVGGFAEVSVGTFALATVDGVNYYADNVTFDADATISFTSDGDSWGGSAFPSGTATAGTTISVPANSYNITFNLETGAYSFNFVRIGAIGGGVLGNWDVDADMATTDGVNYTLTNFTFVGGEAKFRLNDAWAWAWGSTAFPSGTGDSAPGAPNIPVPAGAWDVTFNRTTGAYTFAAPTSGIDTVAFATAMAYPNPAQTAWTINAGAALISNVQLCDITGKVVLNLNGNTNVVTVDATGLANGVYFARVITGEATTAIKLVKN